MRILLLFGLLLVLLLSGCFWYSKPDYPSGWGKLIAGQETTCLDVSGTFINIGEDANHPKRPIGFNLLLYRDKRNISYVQITQPDMNSLEIALWDESGLVDTKYYKKGRDFNCTNEGIRLPSNTELVGENVVGVVKTKFFLMKSDDGSLVVKQSSGGLWLAFGIFPMGGRDYQWCRYKPKR